MPRIAITLSFAWALLLLPALCMGGWLIHPCDCGTTVGCEHEADCASDPCEIGMARSDSWSQSSDELAAPTANHSAIVDPAPNSLDTEHRNQRPMTSPLAFSKALPFPQADLPLLI